MFEGIGWQLLVEVANRAWQAAGEVWRDGGLGDQPLSADALATFGRLTRPVSPFNRPELIAPLIGLAGLVLSLVLAGVAVSSLAGLLVSSLALFLLLTRFFGVSVEITALGR